MLNYEQLLKDESKSKADLPKEIKQKINGMNLPLSNLAKDPDNKSRQETVTRLDVAICDLIQSWIEADLPDAPQAETAEEKQAREKAEADAQKQKADDEAKADAEKEKADAEKAKSDAELAESNRVTAMQNEIVTILNASGSRTIEKASLTNILGRGPADKETIGTLRLAKIYLTTRYKAIS